MSSRFDLCFRRAVRKHVADYTQPSGTLALANMVSTMLVYGACLVALPLLAKRANGVQTTSGAAWGMALLVVLVTLVGTQFRTFLLHHDMCHGGFVRQRWANRWLAVLAGTLVSTAPSVWSREHNRHHRDSNNLDREQDGQTASWTTERFLAAPRWQRRLYAVINWRPVLFLLLPPFYFFGFMRLRARWYENLAFVAWIVVLWSTGTLRWFVLSTALASVAGFLLFHAQHTFDGVLRVGGQQWDAFNNGMLGSSFLLLPRWPVLGRILRWFTYAVQYHHIHHLSPRVAGYRLHACHHDNPDLFDAVPRVTLGDALRTTGYTLYDAHTGHFDSVRNHPF